MSKKSLITSDKIYYKLKWHEKADTKKTTITFLNLGKLKTISYHDWIPTEKGGEIPWHRIYQFHYQIVNNHQLQIFQDNLVFLKIHLQLFSHFLV